VAEFTKNTGQRTLEGGGSVFLGKKYKNRVTPTLVTRLHKTRPDVSLKRQEWKHVLWLCGNYTT